jgi:hypothetical protein
MKPKDEKTLYAAMRLFKSRMRKHLWENRASGPDGAAYPTLLSLEETLEETAKTEWDAALAERDLSDREERLVVETLVGEAYQRSVQEIRTTFDGAEGLLLLYVRAHGPKEILP